MFSVLNSNGAILLEPPKKIDKTFYICDKQFYLDPILEMFKEELKMGVVLISGDSFEIHIITKSGTHFEHQKLCSDDVAPIKRHRKGGQSAVRFSRITDAKEEMYIKMIGEMTIECFMKENNTKCLIDKLIIGGPGNKKHYLKEDPLVQQYFKNNMAIMNTQELNETTVYGTLNECHKYFNEENDKYYNEILGQIQEMINFDNEKLLFGIDEIMYAIQENMVKEIYVSDDLDDVFKDIELNKCNKTIIPSNYFNKIGMDVIGIKWY